MVYGKAGVQYSVKWRKIRGLTGLTPNFPPIQVVSQFENFGHDVADREQYSPPETGGEYAIPTFQTEALPNLNVI